MAYNTGICNSFGELKTALINCCVSNGWTSTTDGSNDVIYKGNLYVMLNSSTTYFKATGRTGINEGSAPGSVGIGNFHVYNSSYVCPGAVTFPVTYFCFTYNDIDEVYFVIEYNSMYQWLAFGKSNIILPGTGLWVAGTMGSSNAQNIEIQTDGDTYSSYIYHTSTALFWSNYICNDSYGNSARNYWLHSNINAAYPWSLGTNNYYSDAVGIKYLTSYLHGQPNEFNQQALLLPILAYHTSAIYPGHYTLVAHVQKARHIKINYLDPEMILYHGNEQWVVFPWFKKEYQSPYSTGLSVVTHTGNFGWAIKKEA